MIDFLYCDGSTFDENEYPELYLFLGNNVLPDYRECAIVGAEQNTTDSIATHDVYTLGEFKDDQLQGHEHNYVKWSGSQIGDGGSYVARYTTTSATEGIVSDGTNGTPRYGTTTHGKQKAVFFYIKA